MPFVPSTKVSRF